MKSLGRPIIFAVLLVIVGMAVESQYGFFERYVGGSTQYANVMASPDSGSNDTVDLKTFWQVWTVLKKEYVVSEDIDDKKMVEGAIAGMTASLGDPYTVYLPPKDNERSGQDLAGAFYGVGIELGYIDGILAVIAPLKDTPAEQAGVEAGDLIIKVRDDAKGIDEESGSWTLLKAVDTIRGPKDSEVVLTLLRPSQENPEPFEVSIKRGEIIVKSVELSFVEHQNKKVAHIELSRFGERTQREWDDVVKQVLAEKGSISGIVLDMRNNPGGFFDSAVEIASEFVSEGTIVSQKGKYTSKDYEVRGQSRLRGIPVVVLVNQGSASASEIVAGALRDLTDAKLVGKKTFGKGTVQDRMELSDGGGLHVTIARWMLPKGDWIHDEGIPVDVEVEQNRDTEEDEQLLQAIEQL